MNLESCLICYIVLHYQKSCCQRVAHTCRVDRLYWFSLKTPVQVLTFQTRVAIKPMQRLLPWPSAVEGFYLGFRRRAALDSANVNKYQPYKNLTILAAQIPVSNQIPAVQTWY